MNLKDIYILNIKNADYCCIISGISKSKAIKLFQNIDLIKNTKPYLKFTRNSRLKQKKSKIINYIKTKKFETIHKIG